MNNIHALMQELGLTPDARNADIASESLDLVMVNTVRLY